MIVRIDVAKAFDKVHRDALASFARTRVEPSAPEASAFIVRMHDSDDVVLSYGKAFKTISLKSGI